MTNKLNLNAMGVTEMNHAEMRNLDGGIWPLVILVALALGASGCATSRYVTKDTREIPQDTVQ